MMNVVRIQELISAEPAFVTVGLGLFSWIFYKIFLREVTPDRHVMLRRLFMNLLYHTLIASFLFGAYSAFLYYSEQSKVLTRLLPYAGAMTIIWGSLVFIKICRGLLFEYLFISHMRSRVPLLLVNLFTLVMSLILGGWILTELFGVKLTPLLATSAILSLVLGLALQDTLGNLFAGIALQIDKPYEIGDWIEIQNGSQKWVGQVHEISWRATILLGFGDELITVSNRTMAQAEISNFSAKERPFLRTLVFKIPYGSPIARAKEIIQYSALATHGVRKDPLPGVIVSELNENWILMKLFYYIDSYPTQFLLADKIVTTALEGLVKAGIEIAPQRISVEKVPERALD